MPRYKTTAEALKIISNKEQIRNFGVIAHVDHGKCVDGESLVALTNGEILPIRDIYASLGAKEERVVIQNGLLLDSMNPANVKMEDRVASVAWNLKADRIVRISLSDGKSISVTPEHPFYSLSSSGFIVAKRADSLKPGDSIAVAGILKSIGSDIEALKEEILALLAKEGHYVAYLDSDYSDMLRNHLLKIGSEKKSGLINDSDQRKFLNEIGSGECSLELLVDISKMLGIKLHEVYDHIEGISYMTQRNVDGKSAAKIRLPKSFSQFQQFFYLVGLLYANSCSGTHLAGRSKPVLAKAAGIYREVLGVETGVVKENRGYRLDHNTINTLEKFRHDAFGYSADKGSHTPSIPRLVSISRKELLSSFLSGLFDMKGQVKAQTKCVCFSTASKELAERLSILLLRYGIYATLQRKGRYSSIHISGPDAVRFKEEIGFNNPEKRKELENLVKSSTSVTDANTLPLDPNELRAVRIALGLDNTVSSIPYYSELESGRQKMTAAILAEITNLFESQLADRSGLQVKATILEAIIHNDKVIEKNEFQGSDQRAMAEALRRLKADRLIRLVDGKLQVTAFGKDILAIWKKLLACDSDTESRIREILNQWRLLSTGEVRFAKVMSVEEKKGAFSVYDLTVPDTHSYVANGIIVHNTTTSDSLLAACGMLSPTVAGQALALDYMPLEQQRQMTIKAANVTLYYEHEGKPYVFNMIDTPGHIDFTGKVTRSLRAIDGAVVVVDSVEGVMTQTETVTRQALEERVRPVLYINKIDRLVKELRLTPDRMQAWLANIIGEFNNLINLYAEPEFRDKWKVSIQDNSVAFGSSKDKWGFNLNMAKSSGIGFKDVYEAYTTGDPKNLAEKVPLHEAILTMVIKHHPPPHVAQSYRIPKIWKGDLESDIGKALLSCDDNGPTVMMVTNVIVDPQAGIVATGRLFSGTIRDGDVVYLADAKREGRVQSVNMYMGNVREIVGALPAGNIPALLGLEFARAGETISSVKGIVPFEGIKYVSEPVVTVAIEAKNPRDLPKLVDALQRMHIEDPNLIVRINEESGETLLSGMGVLHLEIQTTLLQQQGLEIITSPPLINYRETIQGKAGPVMSKSPNKHNKIYIRVEPLAEEVINKIRSGEISETADRKGIARVLRDMGWDSDEARSVVAVDPKGNILLDQTKGVQFMQESMDSLRAGFEDVMNNGPLAYEYCRGVKVIIHHFVPHEDPAHRTYAQLMPAARRAILGAMLMAQPVLLEPVQGIEIKCPVDLIGAVAGVLSSKRGKLINIEQKEVLAIIEGEIPASETFDLSEVMRGATAGKAVWDMHFKSWSPLPVSLQKSVITQIRKRKGLPEEVPPASDFLDTE
ncbi:MAG: elongation factor EF-2 [Conexivisphaerales archaeon]